MDAAKSWEHAGKWERDWVHNKNSLTAATSFWDASWRSRVLREGSEVEVESEEGGEENTRNNR